MLLSTFPIIGEPMQATSLINLLIACVLTLAGMGAFIFLIYHFTSKSVKLIKNGEYDEKVITNEGELPHKGWKLAGIIIGWVLLVILFLYVFASIYLMYLDSNNSVTFFGHTVAIEKTATGYKMTDNSMSFLSKHAYFFGSIIEFGASISGMLLLISCIAIAFLVTATYKDVKKAYAQRYDAYITLESAAKAEQVKEELTQLKAEAEDDNVKAVEPEPEPVAPKAKQLDIKPQYTFTYFGKLAMFDHEIQQRYSDLKNAILKYSQVSNLKSSKGEKFNFHREKLIKICVRGKTIVAYFNIDKALLADSNIRYEEFKPTRDTEDYTVRIKLSNPLRTKHAITLADLVIINHGANLKRNYEEEDFTVKQLTADEAVAQGLGKKNY